MRSVLRLAVVGIGVIGKRVAHAINSQAGLELVGVAVRSPSRAVLAQPHLPYYASDATADTRLRAAGIQARGRLEDLLDQADAVVDCGPARTGPLRFPIYRRAGTRSVFCGGERDPRLGPLLHSALNYRTALSSPTVRLMSCNTTALARLVAAVGPEHVGRLEATVLRCCTDADKAGKGITEGAVVHPATSHHASDLGELLPGLVTRSWAVTLPMVSGHVIQVRLGLRGVVPFEHVSARLEAEPRIRVWSGDEAMETARIKASEAVHGRKWSDRYELIVRLDEPDDGDQLTGWLSLDNEAITIPEALDVARAFSGAPEAEAARAATDQGLGIGRSGPLTKLPAGQRSAE
jgi:glyceraldehyde-3-phosphate dehydrogenase (NAD(P))